MNFSEALNLLKQGYKLQRKGWNGKGMFIFRQGGFVAGADSLPANVEEWFKTHIVSAFPCPNVEFVPYLCMKAADNTIVSGWLASQTDMLSDDWEIVTPPTED